jgi:rubrerythrin
MELKGSKTEKNLLSAFMGEAMAAVRYKLYAEKAHEEGYEQIKGIFDETSDNEIQHAKRILDFFKGIGNTEANLKAGAYGEHEEWSDIYKEMEATAREENFVEIANFFKHVASVEKEHEERYQSLLKLLEEQKVFQGDESTVWVCKNCGYVHVGKQPPQKCPVCQYPQAYYERKANNY